MKWKLACFILVFRLKLVIVHLWWIADGNTRKQNSQCMNTVLQKWMATENCCY